MSLLSEDVAAENYRVVLPPAGGHVVIRPVMILQLQGFDGSDALYETFNFFSVNTWSSMLSRDIGNFGNHGQRTPSIILTRDVISSNDESSSDMASSTFQGIVSAGSYSKSMDSGKKLLDAVWTANLHCNIAKHGQDLFFIYVHDQSIAQLELDHKTCQVTIWTAPATKQRTILGQISKQGVSLAKESLWRDTVDTLLDGDRSRCCNVGQLGMAVLEGKSLVILTGLWAASLAGLAVIPP